jgi:hypothetical protein
MRSARLFILLVIAMLASCKDKELEDAMMGYCKCIDEYKGDDLGRNTCVEYMDSLQVLYANQPRKLIKLIEKASDCW